MARLVNNGAVYDTRGQGSYGLVISPALGNIDDRGQVIQFPGMVTKIMTNRDDFEKAQRADATMRGKVPSLAQNFIPYRYKFTVRNFSSSGLKQRVRNLFQGSWLPTNRLYVARMPDLGLDFNKVATLPTKPYQIYRNVGGETMCREILKLMHIVKSTKDAGYIHGDIREVNVMCNIHTGILTIVDFDWFSAVNRFYSNYPVWFYCHPPEHALLIGMKRNLPLLGRERTTFMGEVERQVDSGLLTYGRSMFWVDDLPMLKQLILDSMDTLWEEVNVQDTFDAAANAKYIEPRQEAIEQLQKVAAETVDSFGLAISFEKLYFSTLSPGVPELAKIRNLLIDTLIPGMTDPNHRTRMRIEKAIEVMEAFIAENYPAVQLDDVPDIQDELRRLSYHAALLAGKPIEEILDLDEPRRGPREEVEALALVTKIVEGIESPEANGANAPNSPPSPTAGGRRRRRKTRKARKGRKGTRKGRKTRSHH